MGYGGFPYGGVGYAESSVAANPLTDTQTTLAVEVAFTTDPLAEPAWVDITPDVRSWSTSRGRRRELERFQPGRATVVLDNRSRQYDSVYSAGPWFGKLKPMKRMRIRETFNGVTYPVFDGFVDKWQLDYPNVGRDSTATLTATDAKVLARVDLSPSVYYDEVVADAPAVWFRLDEDVDKLKAGIALNAGSTVIDGPFIATPIVGQQSLISTDPGAAMQTVALNASRLAIRKQGIGITNSLFSLLSNASFSVEQWIRLEDGGNDVGMIWFVGPGTDVAHATFGYTYPVNATDGHLEFLIVNSAGTLIYGVATPNGSILPGDIHHVVAVVESGGQMAIWLDGTRHTTAASGTAGTSINGVTVSTTGHMYIGHDPRPSNTAANNWHGSIDEFAIYRSDLGSTRVAVHQATGTAPWSGDLPGARIGRVLDKANWPANRRAIDTGQTSLQSAAISDQTVLEHAQKTAESEYGSLFFMSRDGLVRFIDRTHVFGREPYPIAFSDTVGEIGYGQLVPDDGDDEIRNRATISRLHGVAKRIDDTASIARFGIFEYSLDGLLHNSDSVSADYAFFIADQYGDQRRRITSLSLTSPVTGTEAVAYPAMLGLELGDSITVQHTPIGIGSEFSQVCVVEGIEHSSRPGGPREVRFALSPELPIRTLEDVDVSTLGYAEVTADQTGISAVTDLTSLTVTVTVGSSRRIKITGYVNQFTRTAGTATYADLRINEGATQLQTFTAGMNNTYSGANCVTIETPSAGSHTYKLRASSDGTVTMEAATDLPCFILVEDIGPA